MVQRYVVRYTRDEVTLSATASGSVSRANDLVSRGPFLEQEAAVYYGCSRACPGPIRMFLFPVGCQDRKRSSPAS